MNIFKTINELGKKAKDASIKIRVLQKEKKMAAYQCLEKNIEKNAEQILSANKLDIENAFANDLSKPLINRLKVSEESIAGIIKSISEIKDQPDPIGTVLENWEQPNGLKFSKISVPLGVLGVIYESRPNVTVDASCLALKSNNALILRGGSDSYHTSKQLVKIITESPQELFYLKHCHLLSLTLRTTTHCRSCYKHHCMCLISGGLPKVGILPR